MKKIILALSPQAINTHTISFAAYIAQLTRSSITGVLLDNLKAETALHISTDHEGTNINLEKKMPAMTREQAGIIDETKRAFLTYCNEQGIACQVHEDKGLAVEELILETRYADLLILDPEMSFAGHPEAIPTDFTRRVLLDAECPVFIAPLGFDGVEEILFTYNGSANSMFAIRQFATLLPELHTRPVTVLQVNDTQDNQQPALDKLKAWLETRYTTIHFHKLAGTPDAALLSYLVEKTKTVAVLGAYGRSQLSQLFKPSAAKILIKTVPQPLFIAHK
ncbi:universal stress protein [Paraflavitalea pollutisoli]|uniref:universal stress protein n=1 Tax=Paraflavitalea pollutisoli TaxID=3034143 RepID=UPI0023EBCDC0|nr:universal stress protein [Paraflavitalea sp. H1-2-19X]